MNFQPQLNTYPTYCRIFSRLSHECSSFFFKSFSVSSSHSSDSKCFLNKFTTFSTDTDTFPVTITLPVGELITGMSMTENEFTTEKNKLTGMTESSVVFSLPTSLNESDVCARVQKVCHVSRCPAPAGDKKILRWVMGNLQFNLYLNAYDIFIVNLIEKERLSESVEVNKIGFWKNAPPLH